jgi:hypothetical protein
MLFQSITFQHFWSINFLGGTSLFSSMGSNSSCYGFVICRHMSPADMCMDLSFADTCSHAYCHCGKNNWALIEEPTIQLEASYLGQGLQGNCTSSYRLLQFHFKLVEPAKLYFAQCLQSLRGLRGLWRDLSM